MKNLLKETFTNAKKDQRLDKYVKSVIINTSKYHLIYPDSIQKSFPESSSLEITVALSQFVATKHLKPVGNVYQKLK